MRQALYALAAIALAATLPPSEGASVLASVASVLVEALPFFAFGSLAGVLGCGCGRAGARALPVIAWTWALFGPAAAIARAVAAALALRAFGDSRDHRTHEAHAGDELSALVPSAVLASLAAHAGAFVPTGPLGIATGLIVGFAGAPCALGGVAIASSFARHAPAAAAAVLCVSGIADARTVLARFAPQPTAPSGFVYLCASALCAVTAARHGAQLVHPLWTVPLAAAAAAYAFRAVRTPWRTPGRALLPLTIACAGLIVAAPVPRFAATETTLAGAFAGERLDFTGRLVRGKNESSLVRYAMTCCRADAQPVAIRLAREPMYADGTWLRIVGTLSRKGERLALEAASTVAIAPPSDPFIYR